MYTYLAISYFRKIRLLYISHHSYFVNIDFDSAVISSEF